MQVRALMQSLALSPKLNVSNLTLAIFLVVLVVFLLDRVVRAFLDPLRTVPGPLFARVTRQWYFWQVWKGHFEKVNVKLHEKYGPLVRIAPNQYSIDDAESARIIYGHGAKFTKGPWYYASGNADPHVSDLFTDRNPKRHAETRKKFAQLYSMTNLVGYEPFVTDCTEAILSRFDQFAASSTTVNMQHWLQCYAMDLIGHITLAKRFGFLDRGEDIGGLLASLHAYLFYSANVGVYSEWHPILSRLLTYLSSKNGMAYMVSFTQSQIAERVTTMNNGKKSEIPVSNADDFLTKLLRMHSENPEKITMTDVFVACITNIGAGSDTTSISLSAILFYIITTPRVLSQLQKEIDEKASSGDISSPITFAEAQTLPYLQACIKEGLRLHPATGLPLQRVVPDGGMTLCGRFFPQGTMVGVNTWVAHQNTTVFGANAANYRPERWLESPEQSSSMERYFLTFGAGSRTCIGKNISLLEISKLVPELIRRYDLRLVGDPSDLETQNVWFVKQKNFCCRVTMRKGL